MEINHQPIYLRAVDAGTRPCNQHRALASVCKIRSEIFDCAIKEGPHYDLARTICMLYSTESEWGSNQLYSLSRQLIGMWSDAHPAEVAPWLPGRLTTHTHDDKRKKKRKHNFSSWPFFLHVCKHAPPSSTHTHRTKKQCVCNAWWCRCTELISCLRHFKWGFFVLLFLSPANVHI